MDASKAAAVAEAAAQADQRLSWLTEAQAALTAFEQEAVRRYYLYALTS
jgi:hypothetical protein